jgi:hypothetical protein
MSRRAYSCAVVAGALIAYFAIFPDDIGYLNRLFIGFVDPLLQLTQSVATGAWALLIALVIVAGAVRIWGRATLGQRAPP